MSLDAKFSMAVTKLKGISILLVVLGHFNSPLTTLIYSFHIPLFFFLGGFFLDKTKETSDFVKRGFNRLIVPYFIFGIVGWGVNLLKNSILHRPQENITDSFLGLIWWMDAQHLNHYGFVLWFLPALFWSRLFVFILIKHFEKNLTLILAIFSIITIFISENSYIPLGVDKALIAVPWLSFGFIFFTNRNKILGSSFYITAIPVAVVVTFTLLGEIQTLDLATKSVGNLLFTFPYTFSVLFLLIFGCVFYEKNKSLFQFNYLDFFLDWIGMQTFLILIAHPYTNNLSHLLIEYFFKENLWCLKFGVSLVMLFVLIKLHTASKVYFYLNKLIVRLHKWNPKV